MNGWMRPGAVSPRETFHPWRSDQQRRDGFRPSVRCFSVEPKGLHAGAYEVPLRGSQDHLFSL